MQLEFYKMLIKSAKEAAQRARWIFTVAIVVALAQFGASYNFAFSEMRPFVQGLVLQTPAALPAAPAASAALDKLRSEMIKTWVESQVINISPVGIKMHATDTGPVGSVATAAIMVWLVFGMRRENRAVAQALQLARLESPETRAHVYFGLVGAQLFADVGSGTPGATPASSPWLARSAKILSFLPLGALVFVVFTDFLNVFALGAVFRGSQRSLASLGAIDAYLVGSMAFEIAMTCIIAWLTIEVRRLQQGTVDLLRMAANDGWGQTAPGQVPGPAGPSGDDEEED